MTVDYVPDLCKLPTWILRLATETDWTSETECFRTFCRVTAKFYKQPNDHEVPFIIFILIHNYYFIDTSKTWWYSG